jgi:multicomponent Na+:H+ antiporter subunit G
MNDLLNLLSGLCFFSGALLCITGGVGLLRLPDFFTRIHSAGVTETLATPLLLLGIIFQLPLFSLDSFKLILIMLFVLATNPTAAHAMAKAALHGGEKPLLTPPEKDEGGASSKR